MTEDIRKEFVIPTVMNVMWLGGNDMSVFVTIQLD